MRAKRGKSKRAKKSTKAIIAQRVAKVLELRLAGAQFHNIKQYAAENDPETGRPWGVSDRQLWNYINQAERSLKDNLEKLQGHLLVVHLARREALYAQTLQTGDYRTALAVLKDTAELQHLYSKPNPLEVLLASLPPEFAESVRRLLGERLSARGNPQSSDPPREEAPLPG